jgi:predicted DsbA family dithiol-disulfide isomerase
VATGGRREVEREFAQRATFHRRSFLLLPGVDERPAYDDYVISHRRAARERAPGLGFAIPTKGQPYPRSSVPAQWLAAHVRDTAPERLEALEDALYRAVFVDLADVADPEVLRRAARTAGLDEGVVDVALRDRALLARLAKEHEEALSHGITGIPALLVPGQEPIVGAVPASEYREALTRATR